MGWTKNALKEGKEYLRQEWETQTRTSVMFGGNTELVRDCNKEHAVRAQPPLRKLWIIPRFLAKNVFPRSTWVRHVVLLLLLQGRPTCLWRNKLEIKMQNVIMCIVTVFLLMFYFATWVRYNREPRYHIEPQCGMNSLHT